MTSAEQLTARLGGRWHGAYGDARCPAHDDKSPSLSIRDGDAAPLVKCHRGCDWEEVFRALRAAGHWPLGERHHAPNSTATDRERREAAKLRYVLSTWREAVPIAGTPAERYLRSRGITLELPPSLRYHPGLKHKETGLILPAMVAGVARCPDRKIVGLHRTFLSEGGFGKAPVAKPKMALGSFRGGAIRLAAAGPELATGEGIETALSYMQATGVPAWSAISNTGMPNMVLPAPPLAAVVHVLVDLDEGGEEYAEKAAARFAAEGRQVKVARPTIGKDFNDALCGANNAR